MRTPLHSEIVDLATGRLLRLEDPRGVVLSCLEGAVWITHDGDRNDIVLERGASYRFVRKGAIVHPLFPARIALAPTPRAARWWLRVVAAFRPT